MQIIIVGTGKLATELLALLRVDGLCEPSPWTNQAKTNDKAVVVHAGSGRELKNVFSFCQETRSPLIELSTASEIEDESRDFPVVLCPNANILILKFMSMLAKSGPLVCSYRVKLTESHQAQKSSTPGTAIRMARALGLSASDVLSVRDPETQKAELQIPVEHLDRHAYHQIVIGDSMAKVTMETRVFGTSSYASGVARIISAILSNELENRLYEINEFVENGWV